MLPFFKIFAQKSNVLRLKFFEAECRRFLSEDFKKGGLGENFFVHNFFTH